jgi:hypothetical protein
MAAIVSVAIFLTHAKVLSKVVRVFDSWRFKSRDDDHATRARHVSATPASSDEASATAKPRRSKGQNWTPIRRAI